MTPYQRLGNNNLEQRLLSALGTTCSDPSGWRQKVSEVVFGNNTFAMEALFIKQQSEHGLPVLLKVLRHL
jgi:hypothetical protein